MNTNTNTKPISGTKEWSVASVNCIAGCEHNCRYCYARANAQRFRRIRTPDEWARPRLRPSEVTKRRRKLDGRVMFPTTHDITPDFLEPCTTLLLNLLRAENDVLIVSKPHWHCVKDLCDALWDYRDQVLFRFTIGAMDDSILSYWEPVAPNFRERLASLKTAHDRGYETSVSCEPLLEADNAVALFHALEPHATDTIWFGKLNQIRARCVSGTDEKQIRRIEAGQTPAAIRGIYGALKDEPKVRWKESYKQVLGLELADTAGLDV